MSTTLTIEDPVYFDRLAEIEATHWWSRGMWAIASAWLDTALAGRRDLLAVDVGCGAGLTATRLALRQEIAEVVGLDPSPEALAHASRKRAERVVRGSALALPFEDGTVDVATCFDVFQHLPIGGDCRAARELARILRPGGVAIVRANGRGWSGDSRSYRLEGVRGVLESAGLVVRRSTYANGLPSLVQEVRGRLAGGSRGETGRRRVRSHPAGGGLRIALPHPAVNRLMGVVTGVETVLAGQLGVSLPFGHSTLVLAEKPRG